MSDILFIEDPQKSFDEIEELINVVFNGFMALSMDYGYHINNTFGSTKKEKNSIYELRESIHYRLKSSKLHFYLLLQRKIQIEEIFAEKLHNNPRVFDGYIMGNPHFDSAANEIMSIYDSIIFHLSSAFDYLAMIMQYVFGKNPEKNLQWITLAKHCYNDSSEFGSRIFKENIKNVDREFVSKFNDYRAELIHRKKSTTLTNLTWQMDSGRVLIQFKCSQKMKSHFKKLIDREKEYCVTYLINVLIKESVLRIADVLEGIHQEFKEKYNPHSPIMSKDGFQLVVMNPETKFAESPSLDYWKKFMEYKKFSSE